MILLQIYCQIQQRKKFENRLIYARVMDRNTEVPFFDSQCAGLAYRSCDTKVARVMSHSTFPLSPWARMVLRAKKERAHLVARAEMWWWNVRVWLTGIFILSTRSIPGVAIGFGKNFLLRGRWTIISCDLELFNFCARQHICYNTDDSCKNGWS